MTHNTREGIEELKKEFIAEYKAGHKDGGMRSYLFTGQNGSLIADWWIEKLHQELQKAREEERKKVLWNIGAMIEEADFARKVAERTGEALPTLEVQAVIKQVQIMIDRYQSELDQPSFSSVPEAPHYAKVDGRAMWVGYKDGIYFEEPYMHQELQKARESWLREEIVKLKGMKMPFKVSENMELRDIYNEPIQTIIDRYQSELDQANK